MKAQKIVFEQENKQVVQEGEKFFTRIFENGESFESGDFNTLEKAKANLDIVPSTEEKNNLELELILAFLGIKFIDYKGKRTSNGHKTAKTVGQIKDFFGKEVMTSGQFIEDINWWNFQNDWNDLMFLVQEITTTTEFHTDYPDNSLFWDSYNQIDKEEIYNASLDFLKWYKNL